MTYLCYINPPASHIATMTAEETRADLADLAAADVILTDGPLDPIAEIMAAALGIPVRPLSDLIGDAV